MYKSQDPKWNLEKEEGIQAGKLQIGSPLTTSSLIGNTRAMKACILAQDVYSINMVKASNLPIALSTLHITSLLAFKA